MARWTEAIAEGRLFPVVRPAPSDWGPRRMAERAATTLAALAPPSIDEPLEARAFFGAARAG